MVRNNNRVIREILEKVKQGRTWRRVVALLSVVTVLVTANRLTTLVVAMEHTPMCGMEEHVHDESCYDEAGELVCGMEYHVHTDACYQETPVKAGDVDQEVRESDAMDLEADDSGYDAGADAAENGGSYEAEDVTPEYIYDFGGDSFATLSDILASVGLNVADVTDVGESVYSDDQALSVSVEKVDWEYFIRPVRDFLDDDMVELAIFTADGGVHLVYLKNGVVEYDESPEPDQADADQPGADQPDPDNGLEIDDGSGYEADVGAAIEAPFDGTEPGQTVEAQEADVPETEQTLGEEELTDSEPEQETVASEPEQAVEEQETVSSEPEQTVEEEETVASEPEQVVEEQETAASEPEQAVEEQETVSSEPEQAVEEQETAASEPEQAVEEEETVTSEPEQVVEEQETVTSAPEQKEAVEEPGDTENTEESDETADSDEPTDADETTDTDETADADETEDAAAGATVQKAARVYVADIDLTEAVAPLSLTELMAMAAPVEDVPVEAAPEPEAEAAEVAAPDAADATADATDADEAAGEAVPAEPAEIAGDEAPETPEEPAAVGPADWQLTFDETLFTVDFDGADYRVTPTASFETATLLVEAGDSYALNLYNFTLPVLYPAQSFEGNTGTMTVRVAADEGAFPEGTTMSVADVEDETTLDGIASAVEADNTAVKRVHAVDITFFNAAGEEIEPLIPISVSITVNEAEAEPATREDAVVVHVDDAGNAEKLEQADASPDEAAFDAEAFSVYAVVVTEHYISADGQRFAIQLTYGPDAGIPEDAVLKVTEVTDDEAYLDLTAEAIGEDRGIRLARYFDISIMSGEQEIQPAAPVEVKVTLDDDVEADHVQAVHFGEGEPTLIDAEAQDAAVTFEAEGFSVYGIVYTVDFAYEINGRVYAFSIPGGKAIPLAELVDLLHILEDARAGEFEDAAAFVARVSDVEFSDPTLVQVVHEDGAWALQSLLPFTSEETLTVTMDDGERFVVQVTDAQIRTSVITASGETYIVTATYDSETGIPEDAALAVTEILQDQGAYDRSYDEYVASAEDALGREEGSAEYIRLFDIKIVDPEDVTVVYQPAEGTAVDVQIELADVQEKRLDVVHFEEGREEGDVLEAETVEAAAEGQAVRFEADGFSIYAVAGFTLENTIVAGDGNTYKITLTFTEDALLPDGARLEAVELDGEAYEDYVGRTAAAMDAAAFSYARAFDISIVDEAGVKYQPAVPVKVSIELMDAEETGEDYSVVHFAGEEEAAEQMTASTLENTVSFSTDGFSTYTIVKGPSAIPVNMHRLTSLDDLRSLGSQGVYICHRDGYYFTDEVLFDKEIYGIKKTTPARGYPSDGAVKYYFEAVEGEDDQFCVYCLDGDTGERKYVFNDGDESLTLDKENKTAFTVNVSSTGFKLNNNGWYWNLRGSATNSVRFCAQKKEPNNGNNYMYVWYYDDTRPELYDLDGKTYGLLSFNGSAMAKAMMASEKGNGCLDLKALAVMTREKDREDRLLVPDNIDHEITMWTFHWAGNDNYRLSATSDGAVRYLVLGSKGLSLTEDENAATPMQVTPGTGIHEGHIFLKANGVTLTYNGAEKGFGIRGDAGSEWLNLAELSNETGNYYMTCSARKVSVSDDEIGTGSLVVVYTRAWNEERKRYDYYLIDGAGKLVRCYESGDSIVWLGNEINTVLWQFTEYTENGVPNNYYELFNHSSTSYLAPQITGNQILSDGTIGIILDGRITQKYYTPILAWDNTAYAYAGLKVEDGHIVTCPMDEALDFYFAVLNDAPEIDDQLHTVETLDNDDHGIVMRMIDIDTRKEMSDLLGNDLYQGKDAVTRNTVPKLLCNQLDGDYPVAVETSKSLEELYDGAKEVNHLFIKSIYEGTGYYEFNSAQNFATLVNQSGKDGHDFKVYQELGTCDSTEKPTLKHGQFFPYNDLKAGRFASVNRLNLYDLVSGKDLPDSDPRKYEQLYLIQKEDAYFAMEMSAHFDQTFNGLDAWGHDIIFEFSGDDDFWLFVDGELVIDLGGVHSAVPGTVNFRTGEVDVNTGNDNPKYSYHTTLKALFRDNCYNRALKEGHSEEEATNMADAYVGGLFTQTNEGYWTFKPGTRHKMRIFYMERGASASNLHIRFNLASTKAHTVRLSKALKGADASESSVAEFPFQIEYRVGNNGPVGKMPDNAESNDRVFYVDSKKPVKYAKSIVIDGVTYDRVFFLKPGETAEINFPKSVTEYRVVECGVDPEVYTSVAVNGDTIAGTSAGNGTSRKDYRIDFAKLEDRANVEYVNEISKMQSLTIRKKLDGLTPNPDLDQHFSFRLYLGTEFDAEASNLVYKLKYHVKDPDGHYCRREDGKFVPIENAYGEYVSNYGELTDNEKKSASFHTSIYGQISDIPAEYVVEVRELPVGTKFRVVERSKEIPDGYRFRKYVLNGVEVVNGKADDGVSGTIPADSTAEVVVWNTKGYGLRLYKEWSDADFVRKRDPAHFAVFTRDSEDRLTLVEGSVRRLAFDKPQTLYWFYESLPVANVPFDKYEVFEVKLSGSPVVSDQGELTGDFTVDPVRNDEGLLLNVTLKGSETAKQTDYQVSYTPREPVGDNTFVFRVANESHARPRFVLRKQDWNGHWLPGAKFSLALEGESAEAAKVYTSQADGLIVIVYPEPGAKYTLTEVKSPAGYRGLEASLTISIDESEKLTVTSDSEEDISAYYKTTTEGTDPVIPLLIVRDKPCALEFIKTDRTSGKPLQGATFSLYKQVVVNGVARYQTEPMTGYETLTTDERGVIPKLDNTLHAGTYKLKETKVPAGYLTRGDGEDVHFTIDDLGRIALVGQTLENKDDVTLKEETTDDAVRYTIRIPNTRKFFVRILKTDMDHRPLTGASFALYDKAHYDDAKEKPIGEDAPIVTGDVDAKGILNLGPLMPGEYRLVETAAPDGFIRLEHAVRIHVGLNEVTATQDTEQSDEVDIIPYSEEEDVGADGEEICTIRVCNNPGVKLPSTGGPGREIVWLSGLLLILCSALLLTRRRAQR